MTEHNHFEQIEIFKTKLIVQTFKFLDKFRLKLFCEVFHDLSYALSMFTTLARIIEWLENRFIVHGHGSEAGSLKVEVEFHKLSRSFLNDALLRNF